MGGICYTAKDIPAIAQSITNVSPMLQSMEPKRRDNVATYLEEIGSTLSNIAMALREGKPLDELKGAMKMHILMFTQTVAGVIDPKLISELQFQLNESGIDSLKWVLEQPVPLFSEEEDFPEYDRSLPLEKRIVQCGVEKLAEYRLRQIAEASGMFKALASSIRVRG
jgi:hypothetical protein